MAQQENRAFQISYAFSARLDVHVDASSKKMAAALAKYLIEKFEGSAVQTLSVGVANVAIFANEYAKVRINVLRAVYRKG